MNTKFFHQTATSRKKANTLKGLETSTGVWVTEQRDMEEEVHSYFETLFAPNDNVDHIDEVMDCVISRITREENDYLCADFSADEFNLAISQMHKDKSPGPDGFNPGFFQRFWGTVGADITAT